MSAVEKKICFEFKSAFLIFYFRRSAFLAERKENGGAKVAVRVLRRHAFGFGITGSSG